MVRQGGAARLLEPGRRFRPLYWQAPFAWSPAQDHLAFCDAQGVLQVTEPQGRIVRTLAPPGGGEVTGFAWRPDGKAVAWSATRHPEAEAKRTGLLLVTEIESGRTQVLLEAQNTEWIVAGWMPAGDAVLGWPRPGFALSAAMDGLPLQAVPASGGDPRTLCQPVLPHREFFSLSQSDGALACTEGAGRETWTAKRIVVATSTRRPLSPGDSAAFAPDWSPDGVRIAFVAGPDVGRFEGGEATLERVVQAVHRRRIWIARRDGSDLKPLSATPDRLQERPQWTSDGRRLLFGTLDPSGKASLWLADVDAGSATQVAPLDLIQDPKYPPGYYGYLDWDSYYDFRRR